MQEQADETTTADELSTGADEKGVHDDGQPTDEQPEQDESSSDETEPDTFPREYVQDLRTENARYREKAKTAEHYGQRLHVALVAATGRLADPEDLPYNEAHLDDPDALTAAIDDLVERKPHLKSRRVVGDVGQGAGGATADVDLAGILRGLA